MKEFTTQDLEEIESAYHSYLKDNFDDWDTWLIELLHNKDWDRVRKELKRTSDLKAAFDRSKQIPD